MPRYVKFDYNHIYSYNMLKRRKQKQEGNSKRVKLLCYNLITVGRPINKDNSTDKEEKMTVKSVMLFASIKDNNF